MLLPLCANQQLEPWSDWTREQLKLYDPEVYDLIRTTFKLGPNQDWQYTWLEKLPNVTAPPAKFKIPPYYTKFTWAREFTVLGHQASDEALLKANDTIRKMFAYRHDVLKALIADGLKLVVLGRSEKLTDLPEYQQLREFKDFDSLQRNLDYLPETKRLVVSEENVLGSGSQHATDECLVIREFAKALYYVTGNRPVDPNWNNRGRDVQQYELRVKRLDLEFGEKVKELFAAAMRGLRRCAITSSIGLKACLPILMLAEQGLPPTTRLTQSTHGKH